MKDDSMNHPQAKLGKKKKNFDAIRKLNRKSMRCTYLWQMFVVFMNELD